MEEDTMLMEKVKQDDTGAFNILMERYKKPLLNFIFRMVQDGEIAEELAQDVFVKVYIARKKYVPTAKFSTWLFKIATNTTLKYLKKNKRWIRQSEIDKDGDGTGRFAKLSIDKGLGALERLEKKELSMLVQRALAVLPEKEKIALTLRKYEGYSYREIADIMNCSLGAIKTHIHRGKLHLREKLLKIEQEVENSFFERQV